MGRKSSKKMHFRVAFRANAASKKIAGPLVTDLEALPPSEARDRILRRARAHVYHDFWSDLDLPKVELVEDLRTAGFSDLVEKAINGAYDDNPDGWSPGELDLTEEDARVLVQMGLLDN